MKDIADHPESSSEIEGRYRLLVDSITDYAIYMLDRTGVVSSWNAGAERFKGYRADEIVGHHFSRFYTDEDRQSGLPAEALRTAMTEGRFECEGWRVRKDGARFWAHVIIDPIRDHQGDLIGFAKVTRDLTERRSHQTALRDSEEQFRRLVQGVTDYAIYMLDPSGRVSSWNPGAQRIKGYRPEEVIGSHFSRFYPPEDRDAGLPEKGLATAAREGRWEQEGWRLRKDGSRFRAHVVIDAVRDERGELIGFAKITRDITERMEQQKALDQAREALFQSQKLDAIGQLTGRVAHDFNNLLMAILGSLELVRKRLPHDPRITPLLENAIQGAERGASLTQRMLAFARRQELKLEAVELPSLVRGLMSFAQRTLGPSIDVEMRFPASLPAVRTDPAQLESALLNLAVNARDAMPGGGTITITADVQSTDDTGDLLAGDYVRLSVADTGEGMDEDILSRAAEPFFTTKGVGKGTGLGLSMVHGLASQSGGRLDLRSVKGVGTTIDLWLPIALQSDLWAAERQAPAAEAAQRSLTVLAVDDDHLVLMNTAALLEDLGHRVLQAASGQEALAILEQHPDIDLVITDQIMPGMTGLQLCERLAQASPHIPVVIATGFAEMPSGSTRSLPRLAKPFTQAELAAAVDAAATAAAAGQISHPC
ncbi:MAG: domain S-box protein [Caulobacteraceae bacterium]|nr:domain S-box protein [Caulobacteraceae bacterium]